MTRSSIVPFFGAALVAYLVADIATSGGGLDAGSLLVASFAGSCALLPLALDREVDASAARRLRALGILAGLGLLPLVQPGTRTLGVELFGAVGPSLVAALVIDLAFDVPDRPRGLERPLLRASLLAISVGSLVAALAAIAPYWPSAPLVVPHAWSRAPWLALAASLVVASLLRVARPALGSPPEAIAASTWALAGLVPAAGVAIVGLVLLGLGRAQPSSLWLRGAATIAALAVVLGHVRTVDDRRRLRAPRAARRAFVLTCAVAGAAAGAAVLHGQVPSDPAGLGLFAAGAVLSAAALERVLDAAVHFLFAPARGRLLDACLRATERLGRATTLEETARAVLGPLRDAAVARDAEPLLYQLDPPQCARIDAAGEGHVDGRALPDALRARLLEQPGVLLDRVALEALSVRRPENRTVVEQLTRLDALCVVPLSRDGELEGALLVARGPRRAGLAYEELAALEALGAHLGAHVAMLSALARVHERERSLQTAQTKLDESAAELRAEVERLRADARVLKAGRAADRLAAAQPAYSPAMRACVQRIEQAAPLDAAVLLVAEAGTAVDAVGHLVHQGSSRAEGPFVVADCGAIRPERAEAALFGEQDPNAEPHPGWLRLGAGGTVLLVDVPALPREAQRALADTLSTRQAHAVSATGSYALETRLVATSRLPLALLVDAGLFDPELAQWLAPLAIDVPPLRARREDVPSLVLLALDRATRVLGRPVLGISDDALRVLVAHAWPGNLRELQSVVDRAVARAAGTRVELADLPPLAAEEHGPDGPDPLAGTYEALERRILLRALERANGNKSEAARLLDLKRTTFLDKLRRYKLEDAVTEGAN
ncbi:MAG: sigma 54-interacting transcriptional regulator [Kofleriaceae bacterium]|nr:sigma 54-interacting transcriptional regulator [Kofleriaceae bacterium]